MVRHIPIGRFSTCADLMRLNVKTTVGLKLLYPDSDIKPTFEPSVECGTFIPRNYTD